MKNVWIKTFTVFGIVLLEVLLSILFIEGLWKYVFWLSSMFDNYLIVMLYFWCPFVLIAFVVILIYNIVAEKRKGRKTNE